ncbi:MAG: sugar phosphate isomerase/epimerase, partial [Kiritimatiellaeota bacterium]|nr:sugar phosphate isomerase/epimerase [Kiritimatiellota bacterium]
LETNAYAAVEIPSGDWPLKNAEALRAAIANRAVKVATCCGGSDFSYAEPERREAEVAKFLPIIEALGHIGSTGLIVCPARGTVAMGFAELRKDFVENTGKRLAEHAAKHGTTIVLEPLRRNETPFLRQVADGAKMAAEIGGGAAVMGDFWHMAAEEYSLPKAFEYAGALLAHVHIAGLRERIIPGVPGRSDDDYTASFRTLREMNYDGAISYEGSWPGCGWNNDGLSNSERSRLILQMAEYLRGQW